MAGKTKLEEISKELVEELNKLINQISVKNNLNNEQMIAIVTQLVINITTSLSDKSNPRGGFLDFVAGAVKKNLEEIDESKNVILN